MSSFGSHPPVASVHRPTIILPFEGFPGSAVKDIARDMIALAKKLDTPVSSNVNGARLLAFPGSKLSELEHDYRTQLELDPTPAEQAAAKVGA